MSALSRRKVEVMKYPLRSLLLVMQLVVVSVFIAHAEIRITGPRCESASNPLGVDELKPHLSWVLGSSERGQRQTAYQILVASDEDKLRKDQADVWDSGKITSDQSNQVVYQGPALASRGRYYWKVRAWDKDGAVSPYSEPGWWEMALLSPGDWKADWIGQTGGWLGRVLYFRSDLTIDKEVKRARIYVSGLGYYELRLNGQKVGDHVLDPGFTDYSKRVLYATYDVASQLKRGKNTMAVAVGNGWYGMPKVLLQCEITYTDGSQEVLYTHSAAADPPNGPWSVTNGPILANGVYDGETYDARLEKAGWDTPSGSPAQQNSAFDAANEWTTPQSVPAPGGILVSQTIDPIKIVSTIEAKTISEPKPGIFVYDMGQNMAGWAQLKVRGERGTRVMLRFAESLAQDGTVDQRNLRTAAATDTYVLKGSGSESWEPRFTYHGFRYVQLEGFPGKPTRTDLTAKVVRSSVSPSGTI